MLGWIKVHRQLKDSAFYTDSQAVHLWLHLLLSVNHKEAEVLIGQQIVKVKAGQFLTGRKKLSTATGIAESKIQRVLKVFENCHMIEQQTFTKYRLISIVNFDQYQTTEQQTNSKRTASEQQVNTNKNDKNEKKDNTSETDELFQDQKLDKSKPIPHSKIAKTFNETCTSLSNVVAMTEKRKALIKKIWSDSEEHQNIEFWQWYFQEVNSSQFLTGQVAGSDWCANFDWLINKNNFYKVIEGNYK